MYRVLYCRRIILKQFRKNVVINNYPNSSDVAVYYDRNHGINYHTLTVAILLKRHTCRVERHYHSAGDKSSMFQLPSNKMVNKRSHNVAFQKHSVMLVLVLQGATFGTSRTSLLHTLIEVKFQVVSPLFTLWTSFF